MGLAALGLAGCYSPTLRDCTVTCTSAGECAGDQVCGEDRLCAAPSVAGRCGAAGVDAGHRVDAAVRDAPPPDAPGMLALRVQIRGKGSVEIEDTGTCTSEDPDRGDCVYAVAIGAERTAHAIELGKRDEFARWVSLICFGEDATCTFRMIAPTTLVAWFEPVEDAESR